MALATTRGEIVIDVTRALAPRGADRFYNLVALGFYDGARFFRVVADFVAQAGLHREGAVNRAWRNARIPDDRRAAPNVAGSVALATSGPGGRMTQFFINLKDNPRLDGLGFAPFGRVRDLAVARALHAGYGDGPPAGSGPVQSRVHREGEVYLAAEFSALDVIERARLVD